RAIRSNRLGNARCHCRGLACTLAASGSPLLGRWRCVSRLSGGMPPYRLLLPAKGQKFRTTVISPHGHEESFSVLRFGRVRATCMRHGAVAPASVPGGGPEGRRGRE